ncbi:hypothetical protein HPB52_023705 [Rhipicephalus sanguineus]|uniref:Uncharacterized protein n=1 Tax=Rhipicephalus sanguineus TaxID=34632 RepID=A0A9D4YR18_RHISA|nr:hypothetical protein HPB52_023705 [Rhipicephalus sanguineus]
MSANPPKRARQPNFTQGELAALVDCYEEYFRAIESRAAVVRRSRATTGGGPEDVAPLDDIQARVANTLDPEAVFGVSGGLDIGAPSAVEQQPDGEVTAELFRAGEISANNDRSIMRDGGKTTAPRFVYTAEERELLRNLVMRHRSVIENIRTDDVSKRAKDIA